jgi:hypothetical protein
LSPAPQRKGSLLQDPFRARFRAPSTPPTTSREALKPPAATVIGHCQGTNASATRATGGRQQHQRDTGNGAIATRATTPAVSSGLRAVAVVGRRTWCCRGGRAAASGFKREVTINMLLRGRVARHGGGRGHGQRAAAAMAGAVMFSRWRLREQMLPSTAVRGGELLARQLQLQRRRRANERWRRRRRRSRVVPHPRGGGS